MSGSATLVRAIKTRLKTLGISYRELSKLIGVSEPTVKRDLASGNFTLQRLDRICDALSISITELVQPGDSASLTELSEPQEQALASDAQALIVSYLIVNDWKFDEIVAIFQLTESQLVHVLLKLDKLGIVDFRPPKRIRKLTARNFSWRKDGPVQAYFLKRVIPEFFEARFDAQGDEFRFVGGLLSPSSVLRLQASIRRFAAEYEQLAHQDARLPFEQLSSCSAILALRAWEFSEISKLRRDKTARGSKNKQKV
jgi:transcriptional regulator with XRE-family HTH domain